MPGRRNYIRERTEHAAIAPEQQRALHDLLTAQLPAFDRALIGQLAIVQGLFAAALFIGIRHRRWDILVLAATVGLKFAIHMIVSPVGRLAVPAIALEILTIPLAAAELEASSRNLRVQSALVGAVAAVSLLVLTPPLVAQVQRLDSSELPGIRSFTLDAGGECRIRCELERGVLAGLTWTTVWLSPDRSGNGAAIVCRMPTFDPGTVLQVTSDGTPAVSADGVPVPRVGVSGAAFTLRNPNDVRAISIDHPVGSGGALRFDALRRSDADAAR